MLLSVVGYPLAAVIKVNEQCVYQFPSEFLVFLPLVAGGMS